MAVVLQGCCNEMGCSGSLTILLDRPLADDAVVSAEIDGETLPCSTTETDGRPAIVVPTGMGDAPTTVVVSISEDGAAAVEHEVVPTWDEDPFYPNGKRCGGACSSGTAELALD